MVSAVRTVRVHPDRALPEVSYLPGTPAEAVALAYVAARQFPAGTQGGGTQPAASVPACVSSRNAGPIPATCAALGQPGAAAFSRVVALPVLACDRCGDSFAGMAKHCPPCERVVGILEAATLRQMRRRP